MADRRLAWAVVAVIVRYLSIVQPQARRELARWRRRTHAISDAQLRRHVVRPFDVDLSAEGAAVFAVLRPGHRCLVPLLVAYVLLWSYIDVVTEREPNHDPELYAALVDALTPMAQLPSYVDRPSDGSYLRDLVQACQDGCAQLPAWSTVRPVALELAERGRSVQALNHGRPDELPTVATTGSWHETCAAASSPLAIHALFALAADPSATLNDARAVSAAYHPSVSALAVLADHFIDAAEDQALSNHSYLRYYDSAIALRDEMVRLAAEARVAVRRLPQDNRHLIILTAMVCMFFSDEKVSSRDDATTARAVLAAIGPPTAPLLIVLRCRRRVAESRILRGASAI